MKRKSKAKPVRPDDVRPPERVYVQQTFADGEPDQILIAGTPEEALNNSENNDGDAVGPIYVYERKEAVRVSRMWSITVDPVAS